MPSGLENAVSYTAASLSPGTRRRLVPAACAGADRWAYDFGGPELPALLDGTVRPPYHVGYTAYLVVAWNRLHEQTGGVIHLERPHPAGLIN